MKSPSLRNKLFFLIFSLALLVGGLWLERSSETHPITQTPSLPPDSPTPLPTLEATFKVVRIIDGDTVEILTGSTRVKVRYIGIDTPETVHPEKQVECFGRQATEENKRLVEGKEIKMAKDVSETDKYGRLLRYVWVDDIFVNDYLVRNGFAHVSTYPPDVKYQEQFRQAEKEARQNQRGLWTEGACDITTSPLSPQGECFIKGNIGSTGERIYHLPGQRYYEKTVIEESRGERWFCSEEEAQSAGWRKSKV